MLRELLCSLGAVEKACAIANQEVECTGVNWSGRYFLRSGRLQVTDASPLQLSEDVSDLGHRVSHGCRVGAGCDIERREQEGVRRSLLRKQVDPRL